VGAAIADALVRHESPVVCGMPGGGTNLDVLDALQGSEIPFVLTQTESAGVMLAATLGDLTGRVAAAITTLGPGLANAVNGIANAWLDRMPVLYVSDSYADDLASYASRQVIDHRALLTPVTKASYRPTVDDAPDLLSHALAVAQAPSPGPVHIDVATQAAPAPPTALVAEPRAVAESDVARAVATVEASRRPVLIVGCEAHVADGGAVTALARRLGAPVLTTYRGKGAIAETDPLAAGVFTNAVVEQELVGDADLIVTVGLDPVELFPRPWAYGADVVALRTTATADLHVRPGLTLVGALAPLLVRLRDALGGDSDGAWSARAATFAAQTRERLAEALAGAGGRGLSPARVVQLAREAAPPDAVGVSDSGAHMFPASYYWLTPSPRQYLCSSGLATMGYALPGGLAAALHQPEVPVLSFTGDGGFLMNLADLATAATLGAKVISVVFDDRSLSLIRLKQQQRGLSGDFLDLAPVDWLRVAEGFGVAATRAETEPQYAAALEEALSHDGPSVISVAVDPSGYAAASKLLRG
jgi:acetolactate synthase-1/2/3 large subunit